MFYAPGGGLGHLTRALAVARRLQALTDRSMLLWSTSPFAHLAVAEGVPVLRWPGRAEWAGWPGQEGLPAALLARLEPAAIVVDTFPRGPQGELDAWLPGFSGPRVLLRRSPAPADSYDLVLDPVPAPGRPGGQAVGHVLLRSPEEGLPVPLARRLLRVPEADPRRVVLALHAGPPEETLALFRQVRAAAERLREWVLLRLLTPIPLPAAPELAGCLVQLYPAALTFAAADLVIGGAGYNLHAEVLAWGARALLRPLPRSHDDQDARAAGLPTFSAATGPAALAEQIGELLEAPPPPPLPAGERQGAERAAAAIAALLRVASGSPARPY